MAWTEAHYLLAVACFMGLYALAITFSVPGGVWLTLAGGFLFGAIAATVYVVVAATAGALTIFLAARYAFADLLRARTGGAGERMKQGFEENAFNYLLVLRLVPLFPFWLVNLVPAFMKVPVRTYLLATFIGIISAGIAVSMHDTIANLAGWIFIITRKPFRVGDRIQIGDITGDVIDTRPFQFSVIEVKNWVDAEQSTGRIIHVPNSLALRQPLANYEMGFEYIWHEIPVLISFESDWRKAKKLLGEIAETAAHLSDGAEEQIRRAAMQYLIYFTKLTPIVYTTVKESGVMLTIRNIVRPRNRRSSEEMVWEAILTAFEENEDISLAYPTTRFYQTGDSPGGGARGD